MRVDASELNLLPTRVDPSELNSSSAVVADPELELLPDPELELLGESSE
jgi:hypothetical protein